MSYVSKNPRFNSQILTDQGTNSVDDPASGSHKVVNRNGLLYMRDSSGNETAIGSAGATGGINYIDNPSAETGTDGWATYADAAGTTPVDGTGGSANVTLTRTTTAGEILRGDASFELTVDAANRQGEGFSYDFTIDKADQNKVLGIWFDVDATDANYVDDDLQVFIYDKDQSQLITPTSPTNGYKIKGNQYRHRVAFAPYDTSSNDYRLIIHVASTNASGYSVRFDNFEVGPGKLETGSIVTEWQSYTPSNTQGFGTITSRLQWRRNGTNVEISGDMTIGTTAVSEVQIELPNSYTASYKSSTSTVTVGRGEVDTATDVNLIMLATDGDTYLNVARDDNGTGTAQNPLSPMNGNAIASSSRVSFFASVPVAEFAGSGIVITPSTEDLALGPWTAYTPALSNISASASEFYYRRVGDSVEIRGGITASGAATGTIGVDLPSGLTADTSKVTSPGTTLGVVRGADGGVPTHIGTAQLNGTTEIIFVGDDGSGIWNATTPFTWASSDTLAFHATIPVEEYADLGQVPPIGLELASDTQYGLVKKNKWQEKYLGTNVTASVTDISTLGGSNADFHFTGLTVGKIYRVKMKARFQAGAGTSNEIAQLSAIHNSTTIAFVEYRTDGVGPETLRNTNYDSAIFQAVTTSVTFNFTEGSGSTITLLSGAANTTISIEELNNYESESSSF